jgi:hypothetical protein
VLATAVSCDWPIQ